jgi:hypothetical protein
MAVWRKDNRICNGKTGVAASLPCSAEARAKPGGKSKGLSRAATEFMSPAHKSWERQWD